MEWACGEESNEKATVYISVGAAHGPFGHAHKRNLVNLLFLFSTKYIPPLPYFNISMRPTISTRPLSPPLPSRHVCQHTPPS